MKTARKITIKHMSHGTCDLEIAYEVDLLKRTLTMQVDAIDTLLIESFLRFSAVNAFNEELEKVGKLPLLTNVNGFAIQMIVADKARFSLRLVERDFEPRQPTLVMRLLENENE